MTDPMPDPTPAPRASRRRLTLAALLAVPLIGAAVLALTAPVRNGAAAACPASTATAARLKPLARGELAALAVPDSPRPAPAMAFQGPDGRAMSLADFQGRTVLVNLWATWCAPCRKEMPALDALQAGLGGEAFEVVAINVDTRRGDKPRAWLQENGIGRLAYYGEPEGRLLQVLQRSGHMVGLPTTLLVGPDGCEVAVLKGPAEWASPDALALVRAALRPGA